MSECQKPNLCLTLEERFDAMKDTQEKHGDHIETLFKRVDAAKEAALTAQNAATKNDSLFSFLKLAFLALLGVGVTQLGVTIFWAGSINTSMLRSSEEIRDHESRLRSVERSNKTQSVIP